MSTTITLARAWIGNMAAANMAAAVCAVGSPAATQSLPQDPRPAGGEREDQRNPILEGVAVQAGGKLVLLSEVERFTKRAKTQRPPGDRREEELQRVQVWQELLTMRLEEQEGADLGLDPENVGRISRADLQAKRDREGLAAYLAELRSQGKDALAAESGHEQEFFRYFWELKAQGKAFAANRATRDQEIRPGELREIYAENRENLAPVTVQLRLLIVSSEALGGPEAARASCEDARQRVLAGEDLALLVEERGSGLRDSRGLTGFIPPRAIRDPVMAAFAEKAAVDDLSEIQPLINPETGEPDPRLGYQLAELHERRTPAVPEFSSPEVQRGLREIFTKRRSDMLLGRERERLRREAYKWVNPLLAGPVPATAGTDRP